MSPKCTFDVTVIVRLPKTETAWEEKLNYKLISGRREHHRWQMYADV